MKSSDYLKRITENFIPKILSVAAASLLFLFYKVNTMEERFFSIPIEYKLNSGFVITQQARQNVRVILRGLEGDIYSVLEEDLVAVADFSLHDAGGDYRAPITITRRGSALDVESLDVRIEPLYIAITQEEKLTRSIEIMPEITGTPAYGFQMRQYIMTPSSVTVIGPESLVSLLDNITTEQVSLNERREDFTARVRLNNIDSLLTFQGGDVVEFRADIHEVVNVETITGLSPNVIDLNPEWTIVTDLPEISLTLQGTRLILDQFNKSEIQFIVDFAEAPVEGQYSVPVIPYIPDKFIVLDYSPREIKFKINDNKVEVLQ